MAAPAPSAYFAALCLVVGIGGTYWEALIQDITTLVGPLTGRAMVCLAGRDAAIVADLLFLKGSPISLLFYAHTRLCRRSTLNAPEFSGHFLARRTRVARGFHLSRSNPGA